jgi:mono/diheme cytochrome c family protein
MSRCARFGLAVTALIGMLVSSAFAQKSKPSTNSQPVDYLKQIKPLLALHCVNCHGPLRQKGGLRLDAGELIQKGGDSGSAIVAGKPEKSLLLHALAGSNDVTQMPVDGKPLKKEDIALVRRWIQAGAVFPKGEKIAADPRDHWAFKKPVQSKLPRPKNPAWKKNPIDTFIAAQHESRGLSPQPPAEKSILLRRVYLDLIGLPPTPQQLRAFLADNSANAYETVVDQLLQNPQYGERWGRHWMDVWRYSDWYGYRKEIRNSARHIWRWRDWMVESLNKDKPYQEMIVEMLAADELAPYDANRLRATGYLARHYYKFNRNTWLDGVIEHTGKAFLGMTFNCARCHDHMYDPVSQKEYYQLRAIFEPYKVRTDRIAGQPDPLKDGIAMAYDANLAVKTFIFERGNDKYPDKKNPVNPLVPELLNLPTFKIQPVTLPVAAWYPGFRPAIREELLKKANATINKRIAELKVVEKKRMANKSKLIPLELAKATAQLKAARSQLTSLLARITADNAKYNTPPSANLKQLSQQAVRAERLANLHLAEAESADANFALRKFPASIKGKRAKAHTAALNRKKAAEKKLAAAKLAASKKSSTYSSLTKFSPQTSSGRRLALARWIADRNNPLTARVAVNHIWMRHFGRPLVPTVFDFGKNGKPATHPELLDWLAVQFMNDGWSMKKLHRMIVTSNAYRMSSSSVGSLKRNRETDPDNQFLWRMNARRMDAEVVRDSVLSVSGRLDVKMSGPELDSKLGQSTFRRSIYYRHAPEKSMKFLEMFDSASTFECYRRNETVVPQQALAMVNSSLTLQMSRSLAASLNKQSGSSRSPKNDDAFIAALFVRTICRPPTSAEQQACRTFLNEQTTRLSKPSALTLFKGGPNVAIKPSAVPHLRARENLALVLLNHHEFVTAR